MKNSSGNYDWDYARSTLRLEGMPFGWLRANLYALIQTYWPMAKEKHTCGRCHTEQEWSASPYKVYTGTTDERTQMGFSEHECLGRVDLIFQTLSFSEGHIAFQSKIQDSLPTTPGEMVRCHD